jgi:hypothetical protein
MPSVSKQQRAIMCIALAIKQGKTSESYSPEAAKIAREMSEKQLEDFCKMPVEEK